MAPALAASAGQRRRGGGCAARHGQSRGLWRARFSASCSHWHGMRRPPGEPGPPALVAVDLPSGLNADTGAVDPATPHADLTVTFAFPKRGHFLFPGADYAGRAGHRRHRHRSRPGCRMSRSRVATAGGIAALLAAPPPRRQQGHFRQGTGGGRLRQLHGRRDPGVHGGRPRGRRAGQPGLLPPACSPSSPLASGDDLPAACPRTSLAIWVRGGLPSLLDAAARLTRRAIGPRPGPAPIHKAHSSWRQLTSLTVPHVMDADALNALATRRPLVESARPPAAS